MSRIQYPAGRVAAAVIVLCLVFAVLMMPKSASAARSEKRADPLTVVATVDVPSLWPANHNLVNVGLSALVPDNPLILVKAFVFSNVDDEEPTGDGNFSPDASGVVTTFSFPAALSGLRLRAERAGNNGPRVYLILVSALDFGTGEQVFDAVAVVVPHDRKADSVAAAQTLAANAQAQGLDFFLWSLGAGPIPAGFHLVGDGPTIGPKQ
jgi:hypothetical protein